MRKQVKQKTFLSLLAGQQDHEVNSFRAKHCMCPGSQIDTYVVTTPQGDVQVYHKHVVYYLEDGDVDTPIKEEPKETAIKEEPVTPNGSTIKIPKG